MRRPFRALLTAGLFFFSVSAWGQTGNPCDLTHDGKVDAADVQAAINMSLGVSSCNADIAGLNACNIVVVQRVINASLGSPCSTSLGLHVVSLSWTVSNSSNVTGYKVYRATASGGPYTLLQSLGAVTSFTDNTVLSGQTYYYAVTAIGSSNTESAYSTPAQAVISVP
jgi:fibronectin type 3 domain-containing protein